MTLSAQKYSNTFRTVSGLINVVYDTDVILLCDTSLGAVAIELAEIPADSWNTVYKLYVIDKSNNAGTNNITIKAPSGYTVNNSSTFVVNVNGGSAIVRIVSNTAYVAETNYGYPSGIAVQNEGVTITSSATTMNFVGAGVNATAVGGFVTVDVAGTAVVPVTSAQLLTLIGTNGIVPNTWYLVSNAIFTVTLSDTVPILVQGVTTNSVSLSGSGIFLNADYQQVGDYSGVSGFVSNLGVWTSALAPVVGSVVMWNNLNYVNTTGVNGVSSPQIDVVNWSVLAKSTTNGYIQEIDDITYQASSNLILSRTDKRNNNVENNPNNYLTTDEAFYVFQWGNNQVHSNVINSNSNLDCSNNLVIGTPTPSTIGAIFSNTVTGFSQVSLRNGIAGTFRNNTFDANCTFDISNTGVFESNKFEQNCSGQIENKAEAILKNNVFFESVQAITIINSSSLATIENNEFRYARGLNIASNSGTIVRNFFDNSTLQIISNQGAITENFIFVGAIYVTTINKGNILNNEIRIGGSISLDNCNGTISKNVIDNGAVSIDSIDSNSIFRSNKISESLINITKMNSNSGMTNNVFHSRSSLTIETLNGNFGESTKGAGNNISTSTLTFTLIDSGQEFSSNVVEEKSIIEITSLSAPTGTVTTNTFTNAIIQIDANTAEIASCEFANVSWTGSLPNSQTLTGGSTNSYINTIRYAIDLSDPTVYDVPTKTLTIPTNLRSWVGTFELQNAGGKDIRKITGLNYKHAFCFYPSSGTVTFTTVVVAGVAINQIVSSSGATVFSLVSHAVDFADKIYISTDFSDTINTVYLTNIYI